MQQTINRKPVRSTVTLKLSLQPATKARAAQLAKRAGLDLSALFSQLVTTGTITPRPAAEYQTLARVVEAISRALQALPVDPQEAVLLLQDAKRIIVEAQREGLAALDESEAAHRLDGSWGDD